ncbi:MAG: aminotransferase class III-fold pyridoxal phosphate-dependent enzyme [Eubacteriales bacterium]|nr:aminotransferase class III-fold pyridoxal phosphate-dependent enzyme [Eubacteriales bacterium]
MNVKEMSLKYNLHSWSNQGKINPTVIAKAEGIYFWDEDGKKYYDMSSQSVNSNLGHAHPKLVKAIQEQAAKIPFINPGFAIDVRSEAAKKIVEASGLEGAKVFFTNAGAEANENAIKMAKAYTGKWKIFSMYRSYHGASAGAGMLTGEPRHFANEPGAPGFIKFEGPYAYRAPKACKFGNEDDVTAYYLELLEKQIKQEGPEQIAAIWLETVVGSNGILIPPKGYLQGVRKLCDQYKILMVCDEVMSGWYRTGKCFAYQNFNVEPDLVTFAKGCTCGYIPLGGVIASKKIVEYYNENKLICGLTYSGHPMGCALACATIDVYEDEHIPENVAEVGYALGQLLESFKENHACIGEVRYIGLFSAIELVKNKETREPLVSFNSDPEGIMPKILGMLIKEGFYTYTHENMILVAPPLIINTRELNEAMDILDKVLYSVDKML